MVTKDDDVYQSLTQLGYKGSIQDVQYAYLKDVYLALLGTSADKQKLTGMAPPTREVLEIGKVMTNLMQVAHPSLPVGAIAQTCERNTQQGALPVGVTATGKLRLTYLPVLPGQVISQLSFYTGVAAVGTTNLWFALYDLNRNLLRVTNDDGATGFAINTEKKLALASPYIVPDGVFGLYTGFCWVGVTTSPQLAGAGNQSAVVGLEKPIAGSADSGLTTPATAPAVAAVLETAVSGAGVAYAVAW